MLKILCHRDGNRADLFTKKASRMVVLHKTAKKTKAVKLSENWWKVLTESSI